MNSNIKKFFDALSMHSDIKLQVDASSRFSSNFGGQKYISPQAVVFPRVENDLALIFELARELNISVGLRGAGTSLDTFGLSTEILMVYKEEGLSEKVGSNLFRIPGHCSWRGFEQQLTGEGRTNFVLTNNVDATIGGTLSYGGYGEGSVRNFAQIDHVKACRMIFPNGEVREFNRTTDPVIFKFMLGNYGQLGVITTADIEVTECFASDFFDVQFDHPLSLLDTLEDIDLLDIHLEFFGARIIQKTIAIFGISSNSPKRDLLCKTLKRRALRIVHSTRRNRHYEKIKQEAITNKVNNYWQEFVFSLKQSKQFISFLSSQIFSLPIFAKYFGRAVIMACHRPGMKDYFFAFEPITNEMGQYAIGIGIHLYGPKGNQNEDQQVIDLLAYTQKTAISLGGRPYFSSVMSLSDEERKQLFGKHLDEIRSLRDRYDPNHLFNNLQHL